jgi:hypothetical protein
MLLLTVSELHLGPSPFHFLDLQLSWTVQFYCHPETKYNINKIPTSSGFMNLLAELQATSNH